MQKQQSQTGFILLMASVMSMVALSIDAILPASKAIGISIGIQNPADNQLLITSIFLGLGFGQLIFGPVSDSIGRKPTIYLGFIVFIIASFICINANSLETMLFGRVLQGIGLSASKTVCIAMVRDTFKGDYMAKIMSFITMIFILVPIIAPSIGKLILNYFGWKTIFISQMIYGVFVVLWLYFRQPETLSEQHRVKFRPSLFINGVKEFFKFKDAVIFTLISGFTTGSFMVYLSASENIFRTQFNMEEEFPYIFAGMAFFSGIATFLNGNFVTRIGMLNMVKIFLTLFTVFPSLYILFFFGRENPSLPIILIFFGLQLFFVGFLFGNLRSLAMQPIGHIAGVGAAINGFGSTIIAVPLATFIGRFITTTTLPIFMGFSLTGLGSLLLLLVYKKQR